MIIWDKGFIKPVKGTEAIVVEVEEAHELPERPVWELLEAAEENMDD
jgi:hypothetical protein